LEQTQILVYHSWINEYARVKSVTNENGRNKVMFQEPLSHAPIGQWIKSGDLRYIIVNNLEVLDTPGEYVCTEKDGIATFSWIPPPGATSTQTPVLSRLEIIIQMIGLENVSVQGLKFHSNYFGLDLNMNWQHAALVVKRSNGINISNNDFSHTAQTGLFVATTSNVIVDRNTFTDIGYHGLLTLGDPIYENVTITNNFFDGIGITRYWSTLSSLWAGE